MQLNVLVNSAYRAVITDFGSARRIKPMLGTAVKSGTFGTDRRQQTLTIKQGAEAPTIEIASSGEFITMTGPAWTLRWAAPELLHGDLPGLPSDIWALGWICWEVLYDVLALFALSAYPFRLESLGHYGQLSIC